LSGPLAQLRVVELCSERGAWAGKLMADMGADVIKVEPPGGDVTRTFPPFLDDIEGADRSLYFWHYNTSKRAVTLDLATQDGRDDLRALGEAADFVIEDRDPGEMAAMSLDYPDLQRANPGLIYVSITPFGRNAPRANEPATDLTIFGGGGPAWNNGYDDHSLPPVRGGGNQAYHTGSHFGFMAALVALLHRDRTGQGQHIDVNMHAAANVTTEAGSYTWLVAKETVQRQTGRHAGVRPSIPSQVICADGRYVNTGVPPRRPDDFRKSYAWLEDLGLLEEFHAAPLLLLGAERERIDFSMLASDEELQAIFGAGRDAMSFIAAHLTASEFFSGAQARGFQVGIIYSPEEAMADPQFVARGFPTQVEHPELGRSFTYPGAPYKFEKSAWTISRRAPLLGEHNSEVFAELPRKEHA
jgi:crotonobetainyl-CoA:carnitine CoA-transferase CaiB-like acyl-CoA transferase